MGRGATPQGESDTRTSGAPLTLPKHSYWYDFWLFVLFDVAFFLVMYYVVP